MNKYRVGVWHTVYGSVTVEAKNEKEAEQIADNLISEEGESAIDKVTDREYGTAGVI